MENDARVRRMGENTELGRLDRLMKRQEVDTMTPAPELVNDVRERKEKILAEVAARDAADVDAAVDAFGFPGLEIETPDRARPLWKQAVSSRRLRDPSAGESEELSLAKERAAQASLPRKLADAGDKPQMTGDLEHDPVELARIRRKHRTVDENDLDLNIKRKVDKLQKAQAEAARKEEKRLKKLTIDAREKVRKEKEEKMRELQRKQKAEREEAAAEREKKFMMEAS